MAVVAKCRAHSHAPAYCPCATSRAASLGFAPLDAASGRHTIFPLCDISPNAVAVRRYPPEQLSESILDAQAPSQSAAHWMGPLT